jgi:SpoVK/Ycf46/Vps4 family AAA+-type ATPase
LLPPELARKGRFDEIFFVDLPDAAERRAIWEIHLRKRKRHVPGFDLDALVAASDGMSGAEVEQALIDALYEAFDQGRPLKDADLLAALARMVPLSRAMGPEIERLRTWAREKARPASAKRTAVPLEPEWSSP